MGFGVEERDAESRVHAFFHTAGATLVLHNSKVRSSFPIGFHKRSLYGVSVGTVNSSVSTRHGSGVVGLDEHEARATWRLSRNSFSTTSDPWSVPVSLLNSRAVPASNTYVSIGIFSLSFPFLFFLFSFFLSFYFLKSLVYFYTYLHGDGM